MDDGPIGLLYLAPLWKEVGKMSPKDLPGVPCQIYCRVDDIDADFRRAREAGATVINDPADQGHGERTYRARDMEGRRWIFGDPLAENGHASRS
jgi:uncharacterized glyoxalase superfamily protein PhnB